MDIWSWDSRIFFRAMSRQSLQTVMSSSHTLSLFKLGNCGLNVLKSRQYYSFCQLSIFVCYHLLNDGSPTFLQQRTNPLLWAGSRAKLLCDFYNLYTIYKCDRRPHNRTWGTAGWRRKVYCCQSTAVLYLDPSFLLRHKYSQGHSLLSVSSNEGKRSSEFSSTASSTDLYSTCFSPPQLTFSGIAPLFLLEFSKACAIQQAKHFRFCNRASTH